MEELQKKLDSLYKEVDEAEDNNKPINYRDMFFRLSSAVQRCINEEKNNLATQWAESGNGNL